MTEFGRKVSPPSPPSEVWTTLVEKSLDVANELRKLANLLAGSACLFILLFGFWMVVFSRLASLSSVPRCSFIPLVFMAKQVQVFGHGESFDMAVGQNQWCHFGEVHHPF